MNHYTKSLPYEMEITSRVLHEAMRCFFEENKFPISQEEFIILDCIYMDPNIIQMELAKLILKGRAHTGKFLKSLEERGFVQRTPVNQDSKIVMRLEITQKGLEIYKFINETIDEYIRKVSPVSKEQINEAIEIIRAIRIDAVAKYNIKFD